jgi:hypothetical protein
MKKLSDGNFTYPAGTCGASKQSGASDLLKSYATQRDTSSNLAGARLAEQYSY